MKPAAYQLSRSTMVKIAVIFTLGWVTGTLLLKAYKPEVRKTTPPPPALEIEHSVYQAGRTAANAGAVATEVEAALDDIEAQKPGAFLRFKTAMERITNDNFYLCGAEVEASAALSAEGRRTCLRADAATDRLGQLLRRAEAIIMPITPKK